MQRFVALLHQLGELASLEAEGDETHLKMHSAVAACAHPDRSRLFHERLLKMKVKLIFIFIY